MINIVLVPALLLIAPQWSCGEAPPMSAADRITLRDGSVILGVVSAANSGPRGSVEVLVRRDWAEKALKSHVKNWDRSTGASVRQAVEQRRKRLQAWRVDRAAHVEASDRIVKWIDAEVARTSGGAPPKSALLGVRLARSEIRRLERQPVGIARMLELAWLCKLPDPETMPLGDLRDALEARGYALDADGRKQPVALDALLPPTPEREEIWLARRAASELAVDPDLRFLRFQNTIVPDTGTGGLPGGAGLSTALSEIKRLLDPDAAEQEDPLHAKLKAIALKGRAGAVVTKLQIAADMSNVTVESTLWVRAGDRWMPFGSRAATVRPEDLGADAGKGLETDPQVSGAFKLVEGLGLGEIPAELKSRSLRIGAATERALGMARSAFNDDLQALALPVLEPAKGSPAPR